MKSRRDLAPLQFQRAVGVEDELGVVKGSVVTLVNSENDNRAVLARRRRDPIRLRAGSRNGVLIETDMLRAALNRRRYERKLWIPCDESLGENDKLRPLSRRFVDRRDHAFERRHAGREVGGDLPPPRAPFAFLPSRSRLNWRADRRPA